MRPGVASASGNDIKSPVVRARTAVFAGGRGGVSASHGERRQADAARADYSMTGAVPPGA